MDTETTGTAAPENTSAGATKFCKYCGQKISAVAVVCPHCGGQVELLKQEPSTSQPIIINNTNTNTNTNQNINQVYAGGHPKNKWGAFLLCLFLGGIGAHKFYEGKVGMGILYLCTCGLLGIGWIIDLICLLLKPNPYFV